MPCLHRAGQAARLCSLLVGGAALILVGCGDSASGRPDGSTPVADLGPASDAIGPGHDRPQGTTDGATADAGPDGGAGDAGSDGPSGPDGGPPPIDATPCGNGRDRCGSACFDLTTDREHCGGCDRACGADQICVASQCVAPPATCPPEGCPLGSYCDLNAGRCVVGCLHDAECNETESCQARSCQICPAMRGNCSTATDDGCETNLATDHDNCGACGRSCGSGRQCSGGDCVCADGTTECNGNCVDLSRNSDHCGGCNSPCPEVPNGSAACVDSQCQPACNGGFHDCNGDCVSDHDVATCGSSCTPCDAPANGSATCDGRQCGIQCNTGYVACDTGCCESCVTAGCSGLTYCDTTSGLCQPGCERNDQCGSVQFCVKSTHTCENTVDSSCPSGFTFQGECSDGTEFCTNSQLPDGTTFPFEQPCPQGTTQRGSFFCSGETKICVPDP